MKKWVFVHNSPQGLSADIALHLEKIKRENPDYDIFSMGKQEFKEKIFSLNVEGISSILGFMPNEDTVKHLGYEDLKTVIKSIEAQDPISEIDLRPVPHDKIQRNMLSENVEMLINIGKRKSHLVQNFFNEWHDRTLGDKIAETFQIRYKQLKKVNLDPDDIFIELMKFAEGTEIKTASHHVAVLAIVAFFFEQCDIFERNSTVMKS